MSSGPSPTNIDRVLITGGTSLLGRRLAKRLLADGSDVHLVVRPQSERRKLNGLPSDPVLHEHDGSMEGLSRIVTKAAPSTVFHLATRYVRNHTADQIDGLVRDNVLFGTQLLEAMHTAKVNRFINAGTFFQFFDSREYHPVNLYAATKQAFEDILAYYREACGFSTVTLILFDIYGPGDERAKLMAAIRDAQANGTTLKLADVNTVMDLVYIDDAVEALIHAACEGTKGGPYAVGGAERVTLGELVQRFEEVNGTPITVEPGAYPVAPRTPREPWKGPTLPGWQAKVSLADGIRKFVAGET